jgi:hypothetical protein
MSPSGTLAWQLRLGRSQIVPRRDDPGAARGYRSIMEHRCEVRLLGGLEVIVDERPVSVDSWRSRRAADLVKLLALEPQHRLHREQVMESLWPDLPLGAAAPNLRKAIHYARRALGSGDAIHTKGGLLELWPDARVEVDLDRFHRQAEEALSSGNARRAVPLPPHTWAVSFHPIATRHGRRSRGLGLTPAMSPSSKGPAIGRAFSSWTKRMRKRIEP